MSGSLRTTGVRAATGAAALLAAGALIALVVVRTDGPVFTGIEQIPLPGGADLGDDPYEVTAEFGDVLSLAPQSSVKVNDVSVGRVTGIALAADGWSAKVTMQVNGKIDLPANAYARLEQSSLLGEKFIQLSPPAEGAARGSLAGTGRIPLTRTNRNPEVEEVFGALSLLLNGGGINQLKTITTELNKALTGQEPQIRSMLNRVDTLVTDLDGNKGDITRALDGVNRLAATLATREQDVGTVLTGLSPGLKVLEITDEVLRGVKGDYLNVYLDVTAAPGTRIIPALTPDDPTLPPPPHEPGAEGAAAARNALPLPLPAVSRTSGPEGSEKGSTP